MISAIVYNSLTGSGEKYAKLLSKELHIPAKPMGEYVRSDAQVLFISWIFAGKLKGYSKAKKMYNISAVAAVGMSGGVKGSAEFVSKANALPMSVKAFSLQGGFYMDKLPTPYKLIMKLKNKDIAKRLLAKGELNAQEKALLNMASTGTGDPASWDISEITEWCKK